MIYDYKAKATTSDGRELEFDTKNLDQAKCWAGRWTDDGRVNVRITVISSETLWGRQTSRTYQWIHDIRALGAAL